jgi:hypothetical protein
LETYINSGDDGFILLSFGTYAAISSLPLHLQAIFFAAISKFPNIRFLVKFNGDPPENFPKNAKAVQWIPQQDVMGMKNAFYLSFVNKYFIALNSSL